MKIFLFVVIAITTLVMGLIGSLVLWNITHHRYDSPNTGFYRGHVMARFQGLEDAFYSFSFEGETRTRWTSRKNFRYPYLMLEWQGEMAEGSAIVKLPSLEYEATNSTGVLTSAVLAQWLLGRTNETLSTNETQSINTILGFIEAAGNGSFPSPHHHGYQYDQPIRTYIQHFKLGFGVPSYVYFWVATWLILVAVISRMIFRRSKTIIQRASLNTQ